MITKKDIEPHITSKNKINPNTFKLLGITPEEAYNIYYKPEKNICNCLKPLKFISFTKGYQKEHSGLCKLMKGGFVEKKYITKEILLKYYYKPNMRKNTKYAKFFNISKEEVYNILNPNSKGICICGKITPFNNNTGKYTKFCSKKCQASIKRRIIIKSKEDMILNNLVTNNKLNSINSKATNKTIEELYNIYYGSGPRSCLLHKKKISFNSFSLGYNECDICKKENYKTRKEKELADKLKHIKETCVTNGKLDYNKVKKYLDLKHSQFYVMLNKLGLDRGKGRSLDESEISLLIDKSVTNVRGIIGRKELDIYSKKHNLAIEYNGLMWHSFGYSESKLFHNRKVDKEKHLNKTILCEEKGIQLFHIFDIEWNNPVKKHIWISMIRDKQGLNHRIYARKTEVKEVSTKDARFFVNENHMQGYVNASIKLGLYHNNVLVSIMTFGKPRYNKDVEYELLRFCTKKNLTIVGGGSKLLKAFERRYKPKSLLSYANRRWSTGNFYEQVGFNKYNISGPNSFFFKENERILKSRAGFQKHKIKKIMKNNYNDNISLLDNIFNLGYRVIFDSGNISYIKKYN